ncbi:MAG: transcriptional regulator NrdR [Actinobacteria bacterium]|nr:transcriptional regulator NrdR [Actinomycetota bacterium]MBU4451137.1 transcriptional regulator NrdR [Actinomycetota bacterium]
MKCPYCQNIDTKVIETRISDSNGSIRRRRMCEKCSNRFTTFERIENTPIAVIKKDNTRQPFDRNKILSGLIRACIKRNISTAMLEKIVDDIESEIRNFHSNEISAKEIGDLVLKKLRDLDKVAYIRFASVYKQFDSIKQFTSELSELNKKK